MKNGRRTVSTESRLSRRSPASNVSSQVVPREVERDGSCNVCGGTHFGSYRCPYKNESSTVNCEKSEDQMTASDHLKQRLATGSLGGDQDEKLVEQLIAENEQAKRPGWYLVSSDQKNWQGLVYEREGESRSSGNCMHWYESATFWRDKAEKAEAALAQKTRECEESREWEETAKRLDKAKLPCGHNSRYGFTDDGGKTGYCTLCRVEQLGRQVAELKEERNG